MRFGFRGVELIGRRHRAEQDGDIVEQAVSPGEFEEGIDENQDQAYAFDFPKRRRGPDIDQQRTQDGQRLVG